MNARARFHRSLVPTSHIFENRENTTDPSFGPLSFPLFIFRVQSQQWISYCDLELSHSNFSQVESIFSRCLRISTSVDLWRFYLDYIRRINPIDPTNLEAAKQTRSIIAGAFEFALAHIGQDRRAGEIWVEFLNFLREGPVRFPLPFLLLSAT